MREIWKVERECAGGCSTRIEFGCDYHLSGVVGLA